MQVGAHDAELWVSAEALDVIIDMYSDDKTDRLAHCVHLIDRLRGIQPGFKAKVRAELYSYVSFTKVWVIAIYLLPTSVVNVDSCSYS